MRNTRGRTIRTTLGAWSRARERRREARARARTIIHAATEFGTLNWLEAEVKK